jgi:hypothetical protein
VITKREFDLYEAVRQSGITNMFAVKLVAQMAGLTESQVLEIMQNYEKLIAEYGRWEPEQQR